MRRDLAGCVARRCVPEAEGAVLPGRSERHAVGAEDRREDVPLVSRQRSAERFTRSRVEHTDRRVATRGGDTRTIGAVGNPPDVPHAPIVHGDRPSKTFSRRRVPEANRTVAIRRCHALAIRTERYRLHAEAR